MADATLALIFLALVIVAVLFTRSNNARNQGMLGRLQGASGRRSKYAAPPAAPLRRRLPRVPGRDNLFTRAEVAAHASDDDLWLIIRDKDTGEERVYDVTDYIDEHPGGMAIADHAGGDATEGFLGPQHPPTVFELLETYRIGLVRKD
jgi:cytochrome b involved in lipid metabolism